MTDRDLTGSRCRRDSGMAGRVACAGGAPRARAGELCRERRRRRGAFRPALCAAVAEHAPIATRSRCRSSRRFRAIAQWSTSCGPSSAGTRSRVVLRANKTRVPNSAAISPAFSRPRLSLRHRLRPFRHAPTSDHGGDLPCRVTCLEFMRAFLEGRLSEEQVLNYRQETGGNGISSYPHPWLMPDFWQFPTVSMGLGPLMAIYQARASSNIWRTAARRHREPQGVGFHGRRRDGRAGIAGPFRSLAGA